MTYTKNGKTYHCTVEATLDVIGGKWKPLILWHLGDNVMRFGQLQKALPGSMPRCSPSSSASSRRTA